MRSLFVAAALVGLAVPVGCRKKPDEVQVIQVPVPAPADGTAPQAPATGWTHTTTIHTAPGVVNLGGSQVAVGPAQALPARRTGPLILDGYGDPLPPGAVLRLGTERGKPANGWRGATLLPGGKQVLAPFNHQQPGLSQSLVYSLLDVNGLSPAGPPVRAEINPRDEFRGAVAASADGRRVVGINAADIDVLDVASGKRLLSLTKSTAAWESASLSADGKLLAVGGSCKDKAGDIPVTCTVWDVDGKKEVTKVVAAQNNRCTGRLSPDGKTLITSGTHFDLSRIGTPDNPELIAQIWDVATKRELARMPWKMFRNLQFGPDSAVAAVWEWGPNGPLSLIDPRTGKTVHALDLQGGGAGPAAFSPDGKVFAMVAGKAALRWDVATGKVLGTTPRPADLPAGVAAAAAAFDDRGRLVAFGSKDKSAFVWDALAGQLLTPAGGGGHGGVVRAVAFTPDGKTVVSAGADGAVLRWDAATGRLAGKTDLRDPTMYGDVYLEMSADGNRAFVGAGAYDLPAGSPIRPPGQPDWSSIGWRYPTSDGAALAAVGPLNYDKPARCGVVNVLTGKVGVEVALPAGLTRAAAALSPDRKRLYTAVSTKPVNNKLDVVVAGWDVATGRKLGEATLAGAGAVRGFVPVGDRQALVATGMGRVAVIDPEAGTVVREIDDPSRLACDAITVSRDGKLLAVCQTGKPPAATYIRAVRVYDVATGAVRHTLIDPGMLTDYTTLWNRATPPTVMAFSPDGTRLATPALTSVLVWDLSRIDADGNVK